MCVICRDNNEMYEQTACVRDCHVFIGTFGCCGGGTVTSVERADELSRQMCRDGKNG